MIFTRRQFKAALNYCKNTESQVRNDKLLHEFKCNKHQSAEHLVEPKDATC